MGTIINQSGQPIILSTGQIIPPGGTSKGLPLTTTSPTPATLPVATAPKPFTPTVGVAFTPAASPTPIQQQTPSPIPSQTITPQPNVPSPVAGSPFTKYVVMNGYYYGVYPSGSMTRLNPVSSGTSYNNPNDALAAYNTGRGIEDKSPSPIIQALPERPVFGSTKSTVRAWSESVASINKANALASGQAYESPQLLAGQLFESHLAEARARNPPNLSAPSGGGGGSSGGGGGFVASGPSGMGAILQSQLSVMGGSGTIIGNLLSGSWGSSSGGSSGSSWGGGAASSVSSILNSLIGGKTSTQSQDQSLFEKQYQPADLVTYPIYNALHGAADWYRENIANKADPSKIVTPFNILPQIVSRLAPNAPSSQTFKTIDTAWSQGMYLNAPPMTAEFIGMVPVGGEILVRNPAVIPAAAGAGLLLQARGIRQGITERPVEFIAEQAGITLLTMGAGRALKVVSPLKTTGKISYGVGDELVNYRGVYVESPLTSIARSLGRATEFEGTRNLFGLTTRPSATSLLKDFRTSVGTPSHLATPRYIGEGFVPVAGRTVTDVPVLGEYLKKYGVEGTHHISDVHTPEYFIGNIDDPAGLPRNLMDLRSQVGKEGTFYHATGDVNFINKLLSERRVTIDTSGQPSIYPQRGMFFGPRDTVYTQFLYDKPLMDVWERGVLEKGIPDSYIRAPAWATETKPTLLRLTETPSKIPPSVERILVKQHMIKQLATDYNEFPQARSWISAEGKKLGVDFSRMPRILQAGSNEITIPKSISNERIVGMLPKNKLYPGIDRYVEFVVPEKSRLYYAGKSTITNINLPGFREVDLGYDFGRAWDWGSIERIPVVDVALEQPRLSALAEYQLKLNLLSELQRVKPTQVKSPYVAIEEVSVIKRGTGRQFLDLLKQTEPRHKFTGSYEQVVFQRKAPAAHDIDVLVPKSEVARVQKVMADQYFKPQYGEANVRLKGSGVEIYKDGSWQTGIDIHPLEEHTGLLGYGVETGTPVTVEGFNFIPWSEQMQRKVISSAALRRTPEGWTTGPALHRGKDIGDILGGFETRMLDYELKGRSPPQRLIETYEQIKQTIEPGSALSKIYNPRTGKSVAEEAYLRLADYRTDYSPTVYTKIPVLNRYVDLGKFTAFETKYINPVFERAGIGFGTRIVEPEVGLSFLDYPATTRIPSLGAGATSAISLAQTRIYPTATSTGPAALFGYTPMYDRMPGSYVMSDILSQESSPGVPYLVLGKPQGGSTSPVSYIQTGTASSRYTPLYLGRSSGRSGKNLLSFYKRTGKPSFDRYSGYPPTQPPRKSIINIPNLYPPTTRFPDKHPPVIPPQSPPKYPPSLPPKYPPGKPPVTPPGYPPARPPGYPPGKPPTTPPGYPPVRPPLPPTPPGIPPEIPPVRYPPTIPPSPPTPPGIPPYLPPETPPVTIPPTRQTFIIEEWPPKHPKLRLHFDVVGSKWNIRNPIPRLGTGSLPKIELKIENKQYSRDPMRYTEHRPYNKFISWRSGSSWNVANPVPRPRGGTYPKHELRVSNVQRGRFVSMTPGSLKIPKVTL